MVLPQNHQPVLIGIDLGNTALKCACIEPGGVEVLFRLPVEPLQTLKARLAASLRKCGAPVSQAKQCVVSSVRPDALQAVRSAWTEAGGRSEPALFGSDLPIPIPCKVAEPQRVGTDRRLCALGARALAGAPCVVVSVGTAITVDLVHADGAFAGGAILPGPSLAALALHEHTAQLPRVEPASDPPVPGTDTESAIRAGVYWACAGGALCLAERLRGAARQADCPVLLTGGDAPLLLGALERLRPRHEPELIFVGMSAALGLPPARP